jgi:DNA-binding NarL/FixJ family response regulator
MSILNSRKEKFRVVVADDNQDVRDKVVQLLRPDFEVVGTAADGNTAAEAVSLLEPDIVVLDISMPGKNGIETAQALKKTGSLSKIVFLTVHNDADFVRAAVKAGALGYVIKSQMARDLVTAINSAGEGNMFISPCCALD